MVQAIIPHMSETMVSLLYRTVRPLLSVNESVSLQKRAYNVLDSLLKHHGNILTATESRMDILGLIVESLLTCQVCLFAQPYSTIYYDLKYRIAIDRADLFGISAARLNKFNRFTTLLRLTYICNSFSCSVALIPIQRKLNL